MLISSVAYSADYSRVQSLGIIGQGEGNWNQKITREEMAAIAIRLVGMESEARGYKDNIYKDVKGWATGYINMANNLGIMKGTSKDTFNPKSNITYMELLTVIMRTLGYEDKIDFTIFPEDYYQKAVELGLVNIYIEPKDTITRGIAAETLDKSLDIKLKNSNISLLDKVFSGYSAYNPARDKVEIEKEEEITVADIRFNTNITAIFSGIAKGRNDFSGYRVILSDRNNSFSKETNIEYDGKFSMNGFNIDTLTKLAGYKFKIINLEGSVV
jgi:hypothetical protein